MLSLEHHEKSIPLLDRILLLLFPLCFSLLPPSQRPIKRKVGGMVRAWSHAGSLEQFSQKLSLFSTESR